MYVTSIVLSATLAAVFAVLGTAKVLRRPHMVAAASHLGYSTRAFQAVGALELAAVAGLLTGIAWAPLGVAAATGLVALLAGAAVAHHRVHDGIRTLVPPVWLGAVSVATAFVLIAR